MRLNSFEEYGGIKVRQGLYIGGDLNTETELCETKCVVPRHYGYLR